ncbi:DUF1819 family protein [Oceanobacillus locisalsi]|uniref:DUF1819 family protein n=1 Tax=Oceanobacillus locisalsi TaxID=546107 RepID=A0ABW3NKC1_9BACI
MNTLPYRSTIKSKPFLYNETYKVAELYATGFSEEVIKKEVIHQNLFQVKTEQRKREITTTVLKRLKTLDTFLINKIVTTDIHTSKLITLYAILKTDRLFFEFMHEIFREKLTVHEPVLEDRDFNAFFEAKRQQSEVVANWKEYTFYKLKQVYLRILTDAGLLNNSSEREIQIPLLHPDVLDYMRNAEDTRYIDAIIGKGAR